MVVISPVSIWYNGAAKNATVFSLTCINDNLKDSATFYYRLLDADMVMLSEGNLTMTGAAYDGWETNEYAYDWAASELNLTIIQQVTTTTTTTTTTAAPETTTSTTTTTTTLP